MASPARNSAGGSQASRCRQLAYRGRRASGANGMPRRRPARSIRHAALAARYAGWEPSGEINSTVPAVAPVLDRVRAAFAGRGTIDEEDGTTISTDDWWVNVRPSNTEPLLRLNVEARDAATMAALRDEALAVIRGGNDE